MEKALFGDPLQKKRQKEVRKEEEARNASGSFLL
jgi:hypothetical protein